MTDKRNVDHLFVLLMETEKKLDLEHKKKEDVKQGRKFIKEECDILIFLLSHENSCIC